MHSCRGTATQVSSTPMMRDEEFLRTWTCIAPGWPSSPVQRQSKILSLDKVGLSWS